MGVTLSQSLLNNALNKTFTLKMQSHNKTIYFNCIAVDKSPPKFIVSRCWYFILNSILQPEDTLSWATKIGEIHCNSKNEIGLDKK